MKFHLMALHKKQNKGSLSGEGPSTPPAPAPHPTRVTHLPSMPLPLGWTFIHFHSGCASSPFTQILLYISNLTL